MKSWRQPYHPLGPGRSYPRPWAYRPMLPTAFRPWGWGIGIMLLPLAVVALIAFLGFLFRIPFFF